MKRLIALLLIPALILCLAGCRGNKPVDTTGTTEPTQSEPTGQSEPTQGTGNDQATDPTQNGTVEISGTDGILAAIWNQFPEDSRFAVYGGMMGNPVDSAPGKLDLSVADEILSKYLVPAELLDRVEEGASLVHLMNSNLFTAAAFRLKEGSDMASFARELRENIQKNQWICGQPDRLVIAQPEGNYLLMAFGNEDAMELFGEKFTQTFANARIFYDEAIVA